jgi:hypothetical protein
MTSRTALILLFDPAMSEQNQQRSGKQYAAVCVWLLVGLMFANLTNQWIELTSSDKQLTEYAQNAIQVGPLDRRSVKDIRTLIQIKAEQLEIPVSAESITISGEPPGQVRAAINYESPITVPVVGVLYRMQFRHNLFSIDRR